MIDRIKPYAGRIILAALAVLILSVLGVPLIITGIIIGAAYAYTKGYRANLTIIKKG